MARNSLRMLILTGLVGLGLSLSGCSGYDVELKGGVFDLMGISGKQGGPKSEPKVASRPGLVIPPTTAALPPPGSGTNQQVAANGEAFPVNPEDAKRVKKSQIIEQHKKFCENARQRHAAGLTPTLESSPWGPCHESVLRNFTGKDLAGNQAVGAQ